MALVTLLSKHTPITETETQSDPVYRSRGYVRAAAVRPCSTFSPDELFAVKTEGGLTEEGGHELVPVDLVDPPSHGPVPLPRELLVGLLLHDGVV